MFLRRRVLLGTAIILMLAIASTPRTDQAHVKGETQTPLVSESVTVTPLGALQVSKTIRVVNNGSDPVSSTSVLLPGDASSVTASDALGPITSTVTEGETGRSVKVTFRYTLRGEEDGVVYRDAYTFSLRYSLAPSSYLTQTGFGNFRFSINASAGVNSTVSDYSFSVVLPEGAIFQSSEPTAVTGSSTMNPVASFAFKSVQPREQFSIMVRYSYLPMWAAFRVALWVGIVVAIVGIALLLRRPRSREVETGKGSNAELLRSLVGSLNEELALWDDLDELEQALDDGSLGRKDYNRRRRILDDRGRGVVESLSRLRRSVRQISPRYAKMMERVESAEKEIMDMRSSLYRTRAQLRAGRLSRSSFEKQEDDLRRRAGKMRAAIEAVIIELRGEVG